MMLLSGVRSSCELILGLHRAIEVGVQLLEAVSRLANLDREPARVVVRRATLAGDREIGRSLIERRPFIGPERAGGHDPQHSHELRARAQRREYQPLRYGRVQTQLMPDRLCRFAMVVDRLCRIAHQVAHRRARHGAGFDTA
jgi:hypothetical protein